MLYQEEIPNHPITLNSPYIDKEGDTNIPNNILDGRAFPMIPKVTTNMSQSDMKSHSTAGLGPTKTLSVPIKMPRERVTVDSSPHFDRSAKTAQNEPLTGNISFPIIISARHSQGHVWCLPCHIFYLRIRPRQSSHRFKSSSIGWDNIRYNRHFWNVKFFLISFAEISVKSLNFIGSAYEDCCLSIDLDGRNIHQVLSFQDGIKNHNTVRFLFNPPLLLWVKDATVSYFHTKPRSSSVYLQSKFVVSLGRVGSSCGSISQAEWDFPSLFCQCESISSF